MQPASKAQVAGAHPLRAQNAAHFGLIVTSPKTTDYHRIKLFDKKQNKIE